MAERRTLGTTQMRRAEMEIGERWFWYAVGHGFDAAVDEFNYPAGPESLADMVEAEAIERCRGEIMCRTVPAWPTPDGRIITRRRMETVARRITKRMDHAASVVEYLQLWALDEVMTWLGAGLDGESAGTTDPDRALRRHTALQLAVTDDDGSRLWPMKKR